jgi:TrmH family RNA methyltransferase
MFLIEGSRELSRAIRCGVAMESVFFCEEFFKGDGQRNLVSCAEGAGIQLCAVSGNVFEKISSRENCDGVIGLANSWRTDLVPATLPENSLILVAEGIEKPGNLGALVRSAESAGVRALILCNSVADIFNPNVVRASQGAIFSLPIITADNETTFAFLKENSVKIFAATPHASALYFNEDFRSSTAIAVGSEHGGLSNFWLGNCEIRKISLPQIGICDSLNVNDAAAIILYEVLRQRMIGN